MLNISREPVLWLALVRSVLVLVVLFGLTLPIGADAAILVVAESVIAIITRGKVSPVEPVLDH